LADELKTYKDNFKANLPSGVTYDSVRDRYRYKNKSFFTPWDVEQYRSYLRRIAGQGYTLGGKTPALVMSFTKGPGNYESGQYFEDQNVEKSLSDFLAHSRASSAWYFDANGNLQEAASGVARTQAHRYENGEWVNQGYLGEEARTGLMLNSIVQDGTAWFDIVSVSTNLTEGAFGAFPGVSIAGQGAAWNRIAQNHSFTYGTTYAGKVILKAGTSGRARISFFDTTSSTSSDARGVIGSIAAAISAAGTITILGEYAWGDGYEVVDFTFTPNFTGAGSIGIGPDSAVVGETVELYYCQLEEGAAPSSPIITSGSTVTRAADVATVDLSGYDLSGGYSIVAKVLVPYASRTAFVRVVQLDNGDNDNRHTIFIDTGGDTYGVSQFDDNASQAQFSRALTYGEQAKFAARFGQDDFAGVINGSALVADTTADFTGPDALRFGESNTGGNKIDAIYIQEIRLFTDLLPDAALEEAVS
jgi:hypothetical protein